MMNRRGFLGTILGAGATVALPSEVWPFRKIFLPTWRQFQAIEMETFAKYPFAKDMFYYNSSAIYELIRGGRFSIWVK